MQREQVSPFWRTPGALNSMIFFTTPSLTLENCWKISPTLKGTRLKPPPWAVSSGRTSGAVVYTRRQRPGSSS